MEQDEGHPVLQQGQDRGDRLDAHAAHDRDHLMARALETPLNRGSDSIRALRQFGPCQHAPAVDERLPFRRLVGRGAN